MMTNRFVSGRAAWHCCIVTLLTISATSAQQTANTTTIEFEGRRWVTSLAEEVAVGEHNGKAALHVKGGEEAYVYLPDIDFQDGVIEVDIASATFSGIGFRGREEGRRYEHPYFRPQNSGTAKHGNTVQYAVAGRPDGSWRSLRNSFPGKYEAGADLTRGEWFHARFEIAGERLSIYVNDAPEPVLVVDPMLDGVSRGTVGVWGHDTWFANFQVTPAAQAKSLTTPEAAPQGDLLEQKRAALRGGIFTKALWYGKQVAKLDQMLRSEHLTGLNVTVRWHEFEPAQGDYRWETIDALLRLAEERELVVTLAIFGGVWTPDWVYEQHRLPGIDFTHTKELVQHAYGQQFRAPAVWQSGYLDALLTTVGAMGRRYDANPRVVRACVSGPSFFFNEYHLPQWLAVIFGPHGLTEQNYIHGWKNALDGFAARFPNTPLDLALVPFDGRLEPLDELIAYATATYPQQVVFSNHSLNDRALDRPGGLVRLYNRLSQLAPETPVGFELAEYQMSDGASFSHPIEEQDPEVFARVIDYAIESGAWFIHPEAGRLLNPANAATFKRFRTAALE